MPVDQNQLDVPPSALVLEGDCEGRWVTRVTVDQDNPKVARGQLLLTKDVPVERPEVACARYGGSGPGRSQHSRPLSGRCKPMT